MSDYFAPLEDMQFVINELAGLESIAALPNCEDASPDLVESILDEAGKLANEVLAPINHSGDIEGNTFKDNTVTTAAGFKEAYGQFVESGWAGLACNPEFEGQGLPALISTAVAEMWKSANMAFSLCPMLTQGAIEAIEHNANDEIKNTYLPKMVSGEWTGTMNLTEPGAGSDLAAVSTKAVPNGDHYLITGQKIFITWGEHDMTDNIIHLVLARLPDAPAGVKGISLFVVPKFMVNDDGSLGDRNDAYCVSIEHKMGINASPTAVMSFGDNGGAVGYLVGEENQGLKYMFVMMNHARLAVGLEWVAIGERAYQKALTYAKERIQGGDMVDRSLGKVAIIKHPDVRRMLLWMKANVEAARAVAYYTAGLTDHAKNSPDAETAKQMQTLVELLTPIAKGWATEIGNEVAYQGVQIHGGMGFIEETGAAQYMRDARITTIYEGTTGIQAADLIGRKIAMEGGVTIKKLSLEIRGVAAEVSTINSHHGTVISDNLKNALIALDVAVEFILDRFSNNAPKDAAAGSVAFLRLFGNVVGGWQMARAAIVAQKKIDNNEGNTAFYQAKVLTARCFAHYMLTQCVGLSLAMQQGAEAILEMDDEQF